MENTGSNPPPSFLTLPQEVRDMIYRYCLVIRNSHHQIYQPRTKPRATSTITRDDEIATSFIAVVRSIPIITLLRTCKQVHAEIITSIIKPGKPQDQSAVPCEEDTPKLSQNHPASIFKNLRTVLHKEPVRMLFEPSVYSDRVERPYEDHGPKNLDPTDYALMEALCDRHLRPKLFPQAINNLEFRSWLLKLQYYRDCYWKMAAQGERIAATGRTFQDAHLSIRFLARHPSGHAEIRAVADSGNAMLQMGHEIFLLHVNQERKPRMFFYWSHVYGGPSFNPTDLRSYVRREKFLEVMDNEISGEDWMEGWEDSWYRDGILKAIERNE